MEPVGAKNPKSEQPVAMKILDVGGVPGGRDGLNTEIKKFYDEWNPTHVVLTPTYMFDATSERVVLQAIERATVHAQQAKDQGAGSGMTQAYAQYIGESTLKKLATAVVASAGGGVQGGFAKR